jgi:hypothetical protein
MRDARYVRLISWTLQSGSEQFPSFLHSKKLSIEHAVPTFYYAKYKVPTIPSVLQCIMQYLQFQQC